MVECKWNFPGVREIYGRDHEEIRDDGLQGHDLKLLSDSSSEAVDATMYH